MALLSNYLRITVLVRSFILSLTLLCVALFAAPRASAWDVCNETSFMLRVAVVTTTDGVQVPKGWQKARPGQCLLFATDPDQPRYVYAESSIAHQSGVREWKGTHSFCASEDDFTANIAISCALQGFGTRDYLSVNPADQATTFTEPRDFGSKAATAGLQRLLIDNGYEIANIDGLTGRQTSRAVSAFVKDKELSKTLSVPDTLDALEAAAIQRHDDVGVTVCNQTQARAWLATAYRLGAAWESRGWWAVEAGDCMRPHTASVENIDIHLFALLENGDEDDLILKSTTAIPSQFCIAESRFSATDREDCSARGYNAASFRPLDSSADGVKVTLEESDFAPKAIGGLRQ